MTRTYNLAGMVGSFFAGALSMFLFFDSQRFYIGDVNNDKRPDVIYTMGIGHRIFLQDKNGELFDYNKLRVYEKQLIEIRYNEKIRKAQEQTTPLSLEHVSQVNELEADRSKELDSVDRKYDEILSNARRFISKVEEQRAEE